MEENRASVTEIIEKYRDDVEAMLPYLLWLERMSGQEVSVNYDPDTAGSGTMKFPVYDSNFLNFIKIAKNTKFITRNYVYAYTKKRMKTVEDELRVIEKAQIMDMEILGSILAKYVMKGMTKSSVWAEGIRYGVFYKVVAKMKELIEYWTVPM
ncbi:MAG: hypothetical protein E7285_04955 [Lachnospiraceae bacterium]|nr:hypothetical protein [Lachnospiraceae bacterium]